MDVNICGITLANGKPNKAGHRIIAYFDCEYAGLRLNGCALLRTRSNGLTVYPPKMEGPEAVRRSVTILDSALRHRMMEAARTAYRAIGGIEAEWIPTGQRAVWGCDANGRPFDPNHPWNGG
jgi:hypothetical protein